MNKLCFRCFEMVSAKRQEKVVTRFPLHSTGPGLYFLSGGRIISMRVLTGFGRPDQCLAGAREKLSDSSVSQYSHLKFKSTAVEAASLNKIINSDILNKCSRIQVCTLNKSTHFTVEDRWQYTFFNSAFCNCILRQTANPAHFALR